MLTVPPALLDMLDLQAGATVAVAIEDGRLVIEPCPASCATPWPGLLAQSDYSEPQEAGDREWADAPAVGLQPL